MTDDLSAREFEIHNDDAIWFACVYVCETGAGVTTTPAKWCVQSKRHD